MGLHTIPRHLVPCLAWTLLATFAAGQDTPQKSAVAIDRDLLEGVADRLPVQNREQNPQEVLAYNYLLVEARRAGDRALAEAARHDLTYAHLMEEPAKHRGEIVPFEGRLRKLVRYDAPVLAGTDGVKNLYEAWVFGTKHYSNPVCVLLTDLPPGLSLGERVDAMVEGNAFFFKRYRYHAADGVRDAPLLIGHTLTVPTVRAGPDPSIADLLTWFVALAVGAAAAVAVLAWWFYRGDRRARSALARSTATSYLGIDEDPASSTNPFAP